MQRDEDADLIDNLRGQLQLKDREIERIRADMRDVRMSGIAVGVLMARTPGWTEQDALVAWDRACAELTRGGNVQALASYVVQTGTLPGHGVVDHA